jgi:hypothetical protein
MPLQSDILSTQTTTTDANIQTLLAIPITAGNTVAIDIVVMGTNDAGHAIFQGITALYVNIGGTISIVGFTKEKGISDTVSKTWNVAATVDQPNQTVNITVQGVVGTTIRWAVDGVYMDLPLGQ